MTNGCTTRLYLGRDVYRQINGRIRLELIADIRGNQLGESDAGRGWKRARCLACEPDEQERLRDEQQREKGHEAEADTPIQAAIPGRPTVRHRLPCTLRPTR